MRVIGQVAGNPWWVVLSQFGTVDEFRRFVWNQTNVFVEARNDAGVGPYQDGGLVNAAHIVFVQEKP